MRAPLGGTVCLYPAARAVDLCGADGGTTGVVGAGRLRRAWGQREWERKGEGGAAGGGVLDPDAAGVGGDETGADGEPVAGAAAGAGAMIGVSRKAIEGGEDALALGGGDAGPAVHDTHDD